MDYIALILTAFGVAAAMFVAYRAERRSLAAEARSENAESIAKADKARSEYVALIESELNLLKSTVGRLGSEVEILKKAEELCQRERVALLAENSEYRRREERYLKEGKV